MTDNIYILVILAMVGTAIIVVFFILLQMRNQNKILRQKRIMQEAEIAHQKKLTPIRHQLTGSRTKTYWNGPA